MIKNFYELTVWRRAHQFALDIYSVTKNFPQEEQFGLVSQMRRASSSVTANIAEGFGRFHYKDKIKFYHQSRASAIELQDHIFLAKDLLYIQRIPAQNLFERATIIIKELNGLIRKTGPRDNALVSSD